MTQSAAPAGIFAGGSAHGAAHIQHEKPNQDAFSGMNLGGWTLIAVADGHGAAPHFRSDRGARMAVEAAHLAAAQFTRNGQADINEIAELRANLPVLIASIVRLWRVAVLRDVEADPLISEAGQDPFLPYGSTCVLAAFTADMSLFVQIGDGDIVVTAADGKLVGPLPEDTEPTGNQTYSLCQPDAAEHFRSGLFTAPHPAANPTFAMIATDGLAKSFIQRKKLLDIVQRWRKIVADHGMPAACVGLQDWLSNVSLHGNGDDVTLMLYSPNKAPTSQENDRKETKNTIGNLYISMTLTAYICIGILILIAIIYRYDLYLMF